MRRITIGRLIVVMFLFMLASIFPTVTADAWTNGQNAAFVIGQSDFTSNPSGTGANKLYWPCDVALDMGHGKLYVADAYNHRVLRYSYPVTGNQPDAEIVFGQPDFTGTAPGTAQNTFDTIRGVAVDNTGRLWVAEYNNKRVIWFNSAYAISANQPDADGVLGQPDFTSNTSATTQNGMASPYGMTVDASGTLFVADALNNRVLRFDNAAGKANGADADGVLGQSDFTSNTAALTQSGMNTPRGVALSGSSLFIAQRNQARVLRFDNAAGKANGADADGVLGQPDFTSNTATLTQSGMESPGRLAADSFGRLYVSDGFNFDRVVIFADAVGKANGANADFVLGQPDFTTSGSGLAQNRISLDSSSGGMITDDLNHVLILADFNNNRVLLFQEPAVTGVSPNTGPTGGGTVVTITGMNFTDVTAVKFGGTDAAGYTFDSDTQITATSPAGSAGTVHVTVTTAESTSATSALDQFTYENNPPSAPLLVFPANGQTGLGTAVTFKWDKSFDPDGDAVTYHLSYCPDPNFTGCTPVDVASSETNVIYLAGLGAYGGFTVFGIILAGSKRGRNCMLFLIVIVLLGSGALLAACGRDGGVGGIRLLMTHSVSGLAPGTTYYWKVAADDGKGGLGESEVWSFTTQ